jgi:hypothetical protein
MIPPRSSSTLENTRERLRLLIEKSFDSLARIEVVLLAVVVLYAVLIVGQRWAWIAEMPSFPKKCVAFFSLDWAR